MQFSVVAVGRMKDADLGEACKRYAERIQRYLKFTVREVRQGKRSSTDARASCDAESLALLRTLNADTRLFALTRTGTPFDSLGLARAVGRWREEARDVALVIGGAFGLGDEVFQRAEGTISLSSMTLPHEMARLVLLEQLYRACSILGGEPYHKGGA